jgi:hypothetical protein
MDKPYSIKVGDNYHDMDESQVYDDGSYSSLEEAILRCETITIASLKACYEKGIDPTKLKVQWLMFGIEENVE